MTPPQRASREVNKFREHARVVIDHHFGKAKRVTYLSAGMSNFVFSFNTADGDFIIRIIPMRPASSRSFKEHGLSGIKVRSAFPHPRYLRFGTGMIDHPYMVSRTTMGPKLAFTLAS